MLLKKKNFFFSLLIVLQLAFIGKFSAVCANLFKQIYENMILFKSRLLESTIKLYLLQVLGLL